MKKYLFLLLLIPVLVSAQTRHVVEAVAGEDLSQVVSPQMQFLFPEFTHGDVFYKGFKSSGKLNYNMLLGEMQFLENDQVMSLANVKDIVLLKIDDRRFHPFNERGEFTEELMSTDKCQLRVRRKGNVAQHSKKGAYGMDTSTSSLTSYTSIGVDNRQYELTISEKVLISLNNFYYLVGTNGKYILIKNVKAFTKQFPAHRAQIEKFAKDQRIRFDNEDDLKTLLEFCSNLGN